MSASPKPMYTEPSIWPITVAALIARPTSWAIQIFGTRTIPVAGSTSYSYSACVAEVDVDPATGIVRVPKIWIAHDVGRAINAATVMGQIEGSVYMGLGEALMEEMAYRGNRNVVHKIPSLLEYKSP